MRNVRASLLVVAASAMVTGSAWAQTTATGQGQWKGVNGASARYSSSPTGPTTGSTQWNVYTSPYRMAFWIPSGPPALLPPAGTSGFGPTVDIFCVDFNHAANTGTYSTYFTNLGANAAAVATGNYTRQTDIRLYLKAAWLAQQIKTYGNSSVQTAAINGAIWQIMSGQPMSFYNTSTSSWDAASITSWMSQADANYGTVNASDWVVVTDQTFKNGGSQEYITQVTPEPATLLLLGTGLLVTLVAAGALRRPEA